MIVYACTDLIFATRIRSTADSLGIVSRPARDLDMLQQRLDQVDDGKPNEPVTCVMIDLDLEELAMQMIEKVRQFSASIPVVAFGAHVDATLLARAREMGSQFVMPRSQFTMSLPDLVEQLGRAESSGPAGAR